MERNLINLKLIVPFITKVLHQDIAHVIGGDVLEASRAHVRANHDLQGPYLLDLLDLRRGGLEGGKVLVGLGARVEGRPVRRLQQDLEADVLPVLLDGLVLPEEERQVFGRVLAGEHEASQEEAEGLVSLFGKQARGLVFLLETAELAVGGRNSDPEVASHGFCLRIMCCDLYVICHIIERL